MDKIPVATPLALVRLRELVARGQAQRGRASRRHGELLDFLFPAKPDASLVKKQARRAQPHLPDGLFQTVVEFYWGGADYDRDSDAY